MGKDERLMALDFMRKVSTGVYPTPVPTAASRMASVVSQGLLNITLPAPSIGLTKIFLNIGRNMLSFGRGFFKIGTD